MKCKNCGAELNGSEKFCGVCGAPASAATPVTANQERPLVSISESGYAPYDVITAAHARATMANDDYREAKATVANLEEAYALELKTYKSMANIAKFGLVLSTISAVVSLLESVFTATSIVNFAELLVVGVLGPLASTAALVVWIWGIFAIKEYATSHGWFVVFNLYFVLVVITLVVVLAIIVGVPYYLKVRGNVNDDELIFEPYTAIELRKQRNQRSAEGAPPDERHAALINLASCIQLGENGYEPNGVNLLDFAKASGPLFGATAQETVRSWLYASSAALLAVMLQEFLNDPGRALGKLKANGRIQKIHVNAPELNSSFKLYTLNFAADEEYAGLFKNLPLTRRIETDSQVYYAFISTTPSKSSFTPIEIMVFAFDDEITNADFQALRALLGLNYEKALVAQAHLKLEDITLQEDLAQGGLTADTLVETSTVALDVTDVDPVRAILQALVVIHLYDASVDVFQGDASTGYLVFKNYLTWLWFDFSQKLSTVRIGYCQNCGRPFSLAGHRGLPRYYCSERCKTAAKNERTKNETHEMRTLFKKGKSVEEIARVTGRSEVLVREQLSKWTELKHELEDDIQESGFKDSQLLKRCLREKLDMNKLLTKKMKTELEHYLKLRKQD